MYIEVIRQILASDILNWIFAAVGGALAYMFLHRMQNTRERHTMIKEIEDSFSLLMDRQLAKLSPNRDKKLIDVNYRTVLHEHTPWIGYHKDNEKIIDGQRYIVIRNDETYHELISTTLIHETLLWFRRVNKLFNDRIIKEEDLADLWRYILPFLRSRKLEFYRSYLGKDDTYAMLAVCMHCIYSAAKLNRKTALKFVKEIIKEKELYNEYYNEFKSRRFFEKSSLSINALLIKTDDAD